MMLLIHIEKCPESQNSSNVYFNKIVGYSRALKALWCSLLGSLYLKYFLVSRASHSLYVNSAVKVQSLSKPDIDYRFACMICCSVHSGLQDICLKGFWDLISKCVTKVNVLSNVGCSVCKADCSLYSMNCVVTHMQHYTKVNCTEVLLTVYPFSPWISVILVCTQICPSRFLLLTSRWSSASKKAMQPVFQIKYLHVSIYESV